MEKGLKKITSLWLPLVGCSLLTLWFSNYVTAISSSSYFGTLAILGIISFISSISVFRYYKGHFWGTLSTIILLVIGQLWLLALVFTFLVWSVNGFAP